MKTFFTLAFLVGSLTLLSQGIDLPYYTGFDSPAEQDGWVQYQTGDIGTYDWNISNSLSHDYNVGANSTDTVIDWIVSPALNFTTPGFMTMKVTASGFSEPTEDNCQILMSTNDPDPNNGNYTLIGTLSYVESFGATTDTLIDVPLASDSIYIAFRYITIGAAWMTYSIDSITFFDESLGINDVVQRNDFEMDVFPNPLRNFAMLEFSSSVKNGELEIFNIEGKKVKTISNVIGRKFELNNTGLEQGSYIIQLIDEGVLLSRKKLIIESK